MGFSAGASTYLIYLARKAPKPKTVVMLGRQEMFVPPAQRRQVITLAESLGVDPKACDRAIQLRYSEPFLELVTGAAIISIDASAYEGATYVFDLNATETPPPVSSADWVLDIGTTEHVFDTKAAILNTLTMLRAGGIWAADLPCNQISGHGLYQISPALPYSLVRSCPELSFLHPIMLREGSQNIHHWKKLPEMPKERIPVQSVLGVMIMFAITKHGDCSLSQIQQYDYADTSWEGEENAAAVSPHHLFEGPEPSWRNRLKVSVQSALKDAYYRILVRPYLEREGLRTIDSYPSTSPAREIADLNG